MRFLVYTLALMHFPSCVRLVLTCSRVTAQTIYLSRLEVGLFGHRQRCDFLPDTCEERPIKRLWCSFDVVYGGSFWGIDLQVRSLYVYAHQSCVFLPVGLHAVVVRGVADSDSMHGAGQYR